MPGTKNKKPAATKPAASKKPANRVRGNTKVGTIGIAELAAELNIEPKSLRSKIRRLYGGSQVGRGGRYSWPSMKDPQVKEILAKFGAKKSRAKVSA